MLKPLSVAIASILFASVVSTAAHAQDAATPDPATASNPEDPNAADAKNAAKKPPGKVVNLQGLIVTGQRSPKAIEQIPGAINVVSLQEVAHTLAITDDATAVLARTVPGYSESSQAMSNSGENLRGRIALRLFDGVPQGSPLREGTRNGTFTDMGVVGRIEVINGPSASEGIGGAGGVINYISRTPSKEGSETTINARYSTQFGDDSEGWKLGVTEAYKSGDFDFIGSIARIDRGISYDGNGRRVGMNTSGSVSDSTANNIFLKAGYNFGEDGVQRIQASWSKFKIEGHGNYIQVEGCRFDPVHCPVPSTNTSERGHIAGSLAEFNDFEQFNAQYSHGDFFGGSLVVDYYWADQAMRYLPENYDDKQIGPVPPEGQTACIPASPCGPRIYNQSEIDSKKSGIRSSWTRPDLFGVEGLEMRVGLDLVKDEAQQRLALTNTVWVPPMNYKSQTPWIQLSWDLGPVTISGGYRHQNDELHVDDYITSYYRNSVAVQGGGVKYKQDLKNLGAIWRIGGGFSVFAAYGEGFTLPNIGIPLRNINASVAPANRRVDRITDLQAIVFKNKEIGFNWRGENGSLAASTYKSTSPYGASLSVDPLTNDFILTRGQVEIKGWEGSGEWRFSDTLKVTGLYSHINGHTVFYPGGPLDKPMGVLDNNPDKLGGSVVWKFMPQADLTFGFTTLFDRDLVGDGVRTVPTPRTYHYEEHTKGYTLFDLGVNYTTDDFGRLTLGIENVFNKQYILSWSQVPGYQNYWAGRGRMVSLSWAYTF